MKNIYFALLMSLLAIGFYGCDNDDDSAETPVDQVTKAEVISAYADLVYQSYVDAHSDAMDMKNAIDAFVASPSAAGFTLAKNAWLTARETYGTTEAFRFAQGPIDVIGSEEGPEGLLNSWPLDEAYIDYVDQMPNAGIVNDASKTLDKATLSGLNGEGGEENVSIGYHAIEFLLWGQDLTAPAMLMPGQRPYTDYLDQASGGTAANHDRRGMYMKVCADLILDHLQLLLDQWEPGGAYRTTFLALDENEALSNMMTAIATLSKSELAGERVLVAWDNRDQ
ncbi:MAG: imelysin family protein, partial [Bacteroidota bacterium]